jgi:gamma-glutamyltranspeptidase/glutathione hydrolase
MNPQEALDAPRFEWTHGSAVNIEPHAPLSAVRELARWGHDIRILHQNGSFGRGQIIVRDAQGVLCGGTEGRTDGQIAAY